MTAPAPPATLLNVGRTALRLTVLPRTAGVPEELSPVTLHVVGRRGAAIVDVELDTGQAVELARMLYEAATGTRNARPHTPAQRAEQPPPEIAPW